MRGVYRYYMAGCLGATLILMVMVPGNRAQGQTILYDNFDSYTDMFQMYPDQAAFETNWTIDGSCQSNIVSNDYSRQFNNPNSLRQDMSGPGTLMVKDINPGAGSSSPASLRNFTHKWFKLLFAADDGVNGVELWRSTGFLYTEAALAMDINPGPGSSSPANIISAGYTNIYFTADDGSHGVEVWRSNGYAALTTMVKDVNPGAAGSSPANLIMAGIKLFFTADNPNHGVELYSSSGTAESTDMVKDINPGAAGSSPSDLAVVENPADVYTLYFTADDGTNGRELWKSDGTPAGTVMVKDINPGAGDSSPSDITNIGGGLIMFAADDGTNGRELWISDGTAAGTSLVKDINPGASGSTPANLTYWNARLYFTADDGSNGNELWQSDGSGAGTVLLKDINPGAGSSSPTEMTALSNIGALLFAADDGSVGRELWKTNGTGAGTVLLKDINSGLPGSSPAGLAVIGISGTGAGTGSSNARLRVMFSADDGISGNELWRSDGTTAGTVMVKDIVPGAAGSSPANLYSARWAQIGNMLFFSADDGTNGRELWQSDGTETGIIGSSNKRDLVPLIQALDPTKSAVAGTDANPLSLHFNLDLPSFGWDSQFARQATWIIELTDGVDRAPVGPISMVDCGGGISRPQIPMTDGQTHNVFAIGVLAQLDSNPCDFDPDADDFDNVPVVAKAVIYDGATWHICTNGKFGLTEDALLGRRWNYVHVHIKTATIDVDWTPNTFDPKPTYSFTVPRQYPGGFTALHIGTEDCVKSQFDTYVDSVQLQGGVLTASPDPTLGACCFDHTTCTDNQTQADCELAGGEWQGLFTYCADLSCCGEPFADYDYDGDVDQVDFGFFQVCYTGGVGTIPDTPPECDCFDRRDDLGNPGQDGSIDIEDFAAFEACWSGPTVAADPSCDD